jgi:hypothetical protein
LAIRKAENWATTTSAKRNKLKPKPRMKNIDDPAVRQNSYLTQDADWITFDETTCTAADQISIAPGYSGASGPRTGGAASTTRWTGPSSTSTPPSARYA